MNPGNTNEDRLKIALIQHIMKSNWKSNDNHEMLRTIRSVIADLGVGSLISNAYIHDVIGYIYEENKEKER